MATRKAASKATKAQETTTGTEVVKSRKGKLIEVFLTDCDNESFHNQRTGDFTKGDSNPNGVGNSFSELVKSIDQSGGWDEDGVHTGLRDAITGRLIPGAKKGKPTIQIVKGFRRFAAISLLAQRDDKAKTAKIPLILKELTDLEALEENVFENTARDDLTGPDLAWAAYNLKQSYLANSIPMSDNKLADLMGKNQPHISKLIRIVTAAPVVCQAWQESASPLKLDDIERISKLPANEQEAEYEKVNTARKGRTGGVGPGGKPLLEIATKKAERIATTVGTLVRAGLVTSIINWSQDLEATGVSLDGLTAGERTQVGKAAQVAFAMAITPPAPKAEKAKTEKALKGAAASADN